MNTKKEIEHIVNYHMANSPLSQWFKSTPVINIQDNSVGTIEIVFSDIKIINNSKGNTARLLKQEINSLYSILEKSNRGAFISFILKNSHIQIFNESIDFPFYLVFVESEINIYIDIASHIETIKLNKGNFCNCVFTNLSILLSNNEVENIENIEIDLIGNTIEMLQLQHIELKNNKSNKFNIENCNINRIIFWKVISNIDISFNKINPYLYVKQEQLQFMECTFNNRFFLINSFFDAKLDLDGVSFNGDTSFKNLYIKTTDLDKAFFSKEINVKISDLHFSDLKNISRSTFREVKQILENNGNKIDANRFHSYELIAKREELKNEGFNLHNALDNIVYFMNNNISNHGLNWILPLFWMLYIGFFFSGFFFSGQLELDEIAVLSFTFVSSILALSFKTYLDDSKKLYIYIFALILSTIFYFYMHNGFEYLFRFLNVIDFSKDIDNIEFTDKSISKIIMIYLIYHFTTTLRKDTRK